MTREPATRTEPKRSPTRPRPGRDAVRRSRREGLPRRPRSPAAHRGVRNREDGRTRARSPELDTAKAVESAPHPGQSATDLPRSASPAVVPDPRPRSPPGPPCRRRRAEGGRAPSTAHGGQSHGTWLQRASARRRAFSMTRRWTALPRYRVQRASTIAAACAACIPPANQRRGAIGFRPQFKLPSGRRNGRAIPDAPVAAQCRIVTAARAQTR